MRHPFPPPPFLSTYRCASWLPWPRIRTCLVDSGRALPRGSRRAVCQWTPYKARISPGKLALSSPHPRSPSTNSVASPLPLQEARACGALPLGWLGMWVTRDPLASGFLQIPLAGCQWPFQLGGPMHDTDGHTLVPVQVRKGGRGEEALAARSSGSQERSQNTKTPLAGCCHAR